MYIENFNILRTANIKYRQIGHMVDRQNTTIDVSYESNNNVSIRNEFSRDRDRILFSRAFRRLEHKAQIYSHEKGDHFRTRLTHTLEVMQIGKSLALNLGLNEDLVEAIALGHDIGHTPFGHQGERTLDAIMSGSDDLSNKIKYPINLGGFKHNFHSLKILDIIEKKYEIQLGMNLTWQVMEGILKHTRIARHKSYECTQCNKCWDFSRFVKDKNFILPLLNYNDSVTLEGQIVAVADEIAQRQHDLDDGLRDKELGIKYEDVACKLLSFIDFINNQYSHKEEFKVYIDLLLSLKGKILNRQSSSDELYKKNALVRDVIEYFIYDVTVMSMNTLHEEELSSSIFTFHDKFCFNKKIIQFSPIAEKFNDSIEAYINNQIVNSFDVNRFDGKAIYIIRQLFKAYYTNPRQMPKYVLKRLSRDISQNCTSLYSIKLADGTQISDIDFEKSKGKDIEKLLRILKLDFALDELEFPSLDVKFDYTDEYNFLTIESIQEINEIDIPSLMEGGDDPEKQCLLFVKSLIENRYAFMSSICDYIAGMTDNFANSEFKKLYLV